VLSVELASNFTDVGSLVMGVGEINLLIAPLKVAKPYGLAENLHLSASIIEIVFTRDAVAVSLKQVGYAVAKDAATAPPDCEWAGWVRAHILHNGFFAFSGCSTAKVIFTLEYLCEGVHNEGRSQEEVDESGAGNLGLFQHFRKGKRDAL